jgi:hypothetical protein
MTYLLLESLAFVHTYCMSLLTAMEVRILQMEHQSSNELPNISHNTFFQNK